MAREAQAAEEQPANSGAATAAPDNVIVMLDRGMILAAQDLQTEVVPCPEWGGSVIVRGLSGTDRDSFERSMLDIRGDNAELNWTNFRAKLICRTVVDGDGKRLFTDADAATLGKKSALPIQRLFRVAQRLSGLGDDEVKELTESLKEAPSEGSGSA